MSLLNKTGKMLIFVRKKRRFGWVSMLGFTCTILVTCRFSGFICD